VSNQKPHNILFNKTNYSDLPVKLQIAETKMLDYQNKNKLENNYNVEIVYDKRFGERNKLGPRFKKQVVQENLPNKVIINKYTKTEIELEIPESKTTTETIKENEAQNSIEITFAEHNNSSNVINRSDSS